MMTKRSSRKRIYMLMAGVLPIAIALVMLLGQPVIAQSNVQNDPITKDEYFKNAIIHHKTVDGIVMVKSYGALADDAKDLLPPLPPSPPSQLGEKENGVMQPLEKGTVVHLKSNGTVVIGNNTEGDVGFPMPPHPTKAASTKGIVPPPPVAPRSIVNNDNWEEMKVGVVKYYLSGKDTSEDVVKEILDDTDNSFNFAFIKLCEKEGTVIKVIPTKASGIQSSGVDLKVIDDNTVKYYLDGKETTEEIIEKMNDVDIERLDVHKEDKGTSIRVVSKKDNANVKSSQSKKGDVPPIKQIAHHDSLYSFAEQMPWFPGCNIGDLTSGQKYQCSMEKFIQHLNDNLGYRFFEYPALAYPAKLPETEEIVVLQFVVDKIGDISDIEVFGYGDIGANYLDDAKKVLDDMVRNTGLWTPAKHQGKIVDKVWLALLRYELPDKDGKK